MSFILPKRAKDVYSQEVKLMHSELVVSSTTDEGEDVVCQETDREPTADVNNVIDGDLESEEEPSLEPSGSRTSKQDVFIALQKFGDTDLNQSAVNFLKSEDFETLTELSLINKKTLQSMTNRVKIGEVVAYTRKFLSFGMELSILRIGMLARKMQNINKSKRQTAKTSQKQVKKIKKQKK